MKKSLSRQMTAAFAAILAFIIVAVFVVNSTFLGKFYTANKQKELLQIYSEIDEASAENMLTDEDFQDEIEEDLERTNVDVCVVGVNEESGTVELVYTSEKDVGQLYTQLLGRLFDREDSFGTTIVTADNYVIRKTGSGVGTTDYLEMTGYLGEDVLFVMRTPLESIRESAELANRFLLFLGLAGVVLGAVLVWLFSRRITRPIMELARLSEEMADLNFDAKYTGGGQNEISVLGENFNRMSQRLEETISELKKTNNQLLQDIERKEKMEDMRNEFLGNVSHELKTPLSLIQGYAEGLKDNVNEDPESREFYCDVIIDEAGKMNRMVRNLLTLNQLEFGADQLEYERFDIVSLVRGVAASCDILMQQAQIRLKIAAPEELPVWADEYKTEQVVRNYLTNAIHHALGEKQISIRIERNGENARIGVFNTGNPIPEEEIPKLWEKFYKVDKAHTREYGGNGIGLSIVKAIMDSFHKQYGVKNYSDGVEFWFELDATSAGVKELPGN